MLKFLKCAVGVVISVKMIFVEEFLKIARIQTIKNFKIKAANFKIKQLLHSR